MIKNVIKYKRLTVCVLFELNLYYLNLYHFFIDNYKVDGLKLWTIYFNKNILE